MRGKMTKRKLEDEEFVDAFVREISRPLCYLLLSLAVLSLSLGVLVGWCAWG